LRVIGETIDDAAGEAFDKTAKLLGIPYPGGPLIDKHAQNGDPKRFHFPEPKIEGLNFSFSGLKTSILYFLQNAGKSLQYKQEQIATEAERKSFIEENLSDICASVQQRIIEILLNKVKTATLETGIRSVCIAGGVSANSSLRKALQAYGDRYGWKTYIPAFQYCTDNAGMIAITGYHKFLAGQYADLSVRSEARAEW
jgi:N6-L-threonylcarbamoyladenine synthase